MAIIVKIHSGFGNQLFQYAAGRSLALRNQTDLLLDTWSFETNTYRSYGLGHLNISAPGISRRRLKWEMQLRRKTYRPLRWLLRGARSPLANRYLLDAMGGYDARFDEPGRNLYLDGYWQSERYFS
ncbi:MAG: alpha-1,2-fucosyltransferase, partial [Verrucomicrobia bacterium]|nr:alpha-1,2-fucosyltransferase [Verrucomicrobiota bacterium]